MFWLYLWLYTGFVTYVTMVCANWSTYKEFVKDGEILPIIKGLVFGIVLWPFTLIWLVVTTK